VPPGNAKKVIPASPKEEVNTETPRQSLRGIIKLIQS